MASVHLFGTAQLPAYEPVSNPHEAAWLASLFLLFDTVELVGADEMIGPTDSDKLWDHVLTSYSDKQQARIMASVPVENVPVRDYIGLWTFRDLLLILHTHKNYKSLIDAGIITFRPWQSVAAEISMREVAEFAVKRRDDAVDAAVALNKLPLNRRIGITAAILQLLNEALATRDIALSEISFTEWRGRFQSTNWRDVEVLLAYGAVFDLMVRSRLATQSKLPVVFSDESEMAVVMRMAENLGQRRGLPQTTTLEQSLLMETLFALPCILPRSTDALLEIRTDLAAELADLRYHVSRVAADLTYAGRLAPSSIQQAVDVEILRPLNALRHRLRHPTRRLIRNLITGGPFVGATLAYVATQALGELSFSSLSAAIAAIAVAMVKTHSDETVAIEESPVASCYESRSTKADNLPGD